MKFLVHNRFLSIVGCHFEANTAATGGGVCFKASNTNLLVSASTFVSNSAKEQGGSLYFGEDHRLAVLEGINVTGSQSARGGGEESAAIPTRAASFIIDKR